jgi:hypothetical protein
MAGAGECRGTAGPGSQLTSCGRISVTTLLPCAAPSAGSAQRASAATAAPCASALLPTHTTCPTAPAMAGMSEASGGSAAACHVAMSPTSASTALPARLRNRNHIICHVISYHKSHITYHISYGHTKPTVSASRRPGCPKPGGAGVACHVAMSLTTASTGQQVSPADRAQRPAMRLCPALPCPRA